VTEPREINRNISEMLAKEKNNAEALVTHKKAKKRSRERVFRLRAERKGKSCEP